MSRANRKAAGGAAVAAASLATLGLACLGGAIRGGGQFAFRDAGYFYYPLHQLVLREWQAGRWPLWAPELNGGRPLLGDPTAAVLYPGKLIFLLLPYPAAARAYVVAHVALAFGAMRWLLRGWGCSATGATIGASAYAFGAPVLSLTCNVVYLVGAAWTPLGFLAADRWLTGGSRRALAPLALVLAMQTLGGDPEAAYLTVVAAAAYAVGLAASRTPRGLAGVMTRGAVTLALAYAVLFAATWWAVRARVEGPSPPIGVVVAAAWGIAAIFVVRRVRRGLAAMLGGLAFAATVGLAVAGAQVVPALEFAGLSLRASEAQASYDIYRFEVHPLHLVEAAWPGVFGTVERGNRSWALALPFTRGPQRWVPSIYLGALTLVLAAAGAGLRGGPPWRAWLTCVAAVSLLAAFGAYASPLFWARCVPGWSSVLGPPELAGGAGARVDGFPRDGDGGVYWLFATALPGFGMFRYPGKLLVFTSLAVSGLAGAGWDLIVAGRSRGRARSLAIALLALSLALLVGSWVAEGRIRLGLDAAARALISVNGPLDVRGAVADLRTAFATGGIMAAVALLVIATAPRHPRFAAVVALAAMTADLALANSRHVVTVPQSAFEGMPMALKAIAEAERAHPSPGPFRVATVGSWVPRGWLARRSVRRTEEMTRRDRDILRPNYGASFGVRSTFGQGSMELSEYAPFFVPWVVRPRDASAVALGLRPGQLVLYHPRKGFDLWNTRYVIVPISLDAASPERGHASFMPRSTQVFQSTEEDFRLLRNDAAFPRAWIVHDARLVHPDRGRDPGGRRQLMRDLLYPDDDFWRDPALRAMDLRSTALIETDRMREVARLLSRASPDPAESVRVTRDEPQHVELEASLRSAGVAILADVFYPGWTLTVDGRPAEILRANRMMRGAAVDAGTHRLVYRYEPRSFRIGMALSWAGLLVLAALFATAWAREGS